MEIKGLNSVCVRDGVRNHTPSPVDVASCLAGPVFIAFLLPLALGMSLFLHVRPLLLSQVRLCDRAEGPDHKGAAVLYGLTMVV